VFKRFERIERSRLPAPIALRRRCRVVLPCERDRIPANRSVGSINSCINVTPSTSEPANSCVDQKTSKGLLRCARQLA
jgi:hypothetical protein